MRYLILSISFLFATAFRPAFLGVSYPPTLKLALLKYSGGGDWYNDVNSLSREILQ